jgi:hypothetical protein
MSNLFWLTLYELDLHRLNRDVYWSDAEYYLSGKGKSLFSFPGFDWLVSDLVSFGFSPLFLRLFIIIILGFVHMLLFRLTELKRINKWFVLLVLCNPFFALPLIRIMKDTYFLFLLCFILDIYRRRNLFAYIVLLLGFITLPSVRPWSVGLPLLFLLRDAMVSGQIKKKLLIGVFIISMFSLINIDYIMLWINYLLSGDIGDYNLSIKNQILGLARIFFSPGLYRIIHPDIYFKYWMPSLLLSVGIGLLLNYYLIATFSLKKFVLLLKNNYSISLLFLYVISAIFVYSFAYAGSVEFRIKASILLPLAYILAKGAVWNTRNLTLVLLKYCIIIAVFVSYGF